MAPDLTHGGDDLDQDALLVKHLMGGIAEVFEQHEASPKIFIAALTMMLKLAFEEATEQGVDVMKGAQLLMLAATPNVDKRKAN